MSLRATMATAERVLSQLRRDPRTVALLLLVPSGLLTLMKYILQGHPLAFQQIGAPLLGMFPFLTMFLITSITMLRERTTGTLERLMTLPLSKPDLLFGYGVAFAAVATVQALLVSALGFEALGLKAAHPTWIVIALAVGNALLGMSLGLFVSAFARTEFQAVQFMPAFVLPQILLCGLFVPRDQMSGLLQAISEVLPLTYAYDALERVTMPERLGFALLIDVAVITGAILIGLVLGALTLQRRTA